MDAIYDERSFNAGMEAAHESLEEEAYNHGEDSVRYRLFRSKRDGVERFVVAKADVNVRDRFTEGNFVPVTRVMQPPRIIYDGNDINTAYRTIAEDATDVQEVSVRMPLGPYTPNPQRFK
ncbi:TPA: hypothetical protein HA251_00415 [Candidatus Woesearchaeota archaeon]|nr:hypothetical protein [Candidatus Woesearchaeota archaeon]